MKQVITARDIDEMLANGSTEIPANAILTPSAKDRLRGTALTTQSATAAPVAAPEPVIPDYEYRWVSGNDPKTPQQIQAFFLSPEIEILKQRMCDMGRRMWDRGYTDGNGGNLTIRVGDNLVLCTPTLISKGFMKPEDMCLVDMDGVQLAGRLKRTSECMTHLAVMKAQPKAKSCCHAHPPHATAFAVAKVQPPTCLIPEAEVFLGEIGMAEYQTPGTPENAKVVGEAAVDHMSVLMLNHGVITWGKDIEDAYWKMENTDAYCQTVWMASQLGKELTPISGGQAKQLITLRASLGMDDKRAEWKECELCDNSEFRPGFISYDKKPDCGCPLPDASNDAPLNADAEQLVKTITDQLVQQLGTA